MVPQHRSLENIKVLLTEAPKQTCQMLSTTQVLAKSNQLLSVHFVVLYDGNILKDILKTENLGSISVPGQDWVHWVPASMLLEADASAADHSWASAKI
jgi:hypothetical protein